MVGNHTFRVACGTRGVVEGDRTELVFRQGPLEIRIALPQERFVVHFAEQRAAVVQRVVDVDHQYPTLHHAQRGFDDLAEFAVGDQYFGFTVGELKSDSFGVEADVQRVQHRAGHWDAEMRLIHGGNI